MKKYTKEELEKPSRDKDVERLLKHQWISDVAVISKILSSDFLSCSDELLLKFNFISDAPLNLNLTKKEKNKLMKIIGQQLTEQINLHWTKDNSIKQ